MKTWFKDCEDKELIGDYVCDAHYLKLTQLYLNVIMNNIKEDYTDIEQKSDGYPFKLTSL